MILEQEEVSGWATSFESTIEVMSAKTGQNEVTAAIYFVGYHLYVQLRIEKLAAVLYLIRRSE